MANGARDQGFRHGERRVVHHLEAEILERMENGQLARAGQAGHENQAVSW